MVNIMKIKNKTSLIAGLVVVLLFSTSFVVANEKHFDELNSLETEKKFLMLMKKEV